VLCVFSYVAAGSDNKKAISSTHLQQRTHIQSQSHVQQSPKVQQTHLPQQPPSKLQTIISKPNQSQQSKPVQVPLKQAGQPVPVKTECVQPPQKLPVVPERKLSNTSPPSSDPPKIKAPQLTETSKRAHSVTTSSTTTTTRGTPPPIPARSGSVQYSSVPQSMSQQVRPVRRQNTLNSAMPAITPQAAPEFYIPQRRGSITRQQSSSSPPTSSSSTSSSKGLK
jgi:hypothetical protein